MTSPIPVMQSDAGGPFRLEREMGCTVAEFERWLPGASRHARIESRSEADGIRHSIHTHGGAVEILLQERPPRRIASVSLPVLAVTFLFHGMDDAGRADFLTYFDHYTRRGGG